MDPLSALSLASSVVQLVDASCNAFKLCHEIYKLGASVEDSRMAYTSDQLYQSYTALNKSIIHDAAATSSSKVLRNGVDLADLSSQCCETARILHSELESLRKSPGGGIRDAISIAMKKRKKAKKIEDLKLRLDEYQKVLDSKVLIEIRQDLGTLGTIQERQHEKTELQLSRLSTQLAECHIPASAHLRAEIDRAMRADEKQHIVTRQHVKTHISAAVQDLHSAQARHLRKEAEARASQQVVDTFLKSLTYNEINLRMNEVSDIHPGTFDWVFDETRAAPWDCFATWLKGDESIYWVNGKAGSGKSTLIKFMAKNPQTSELLKIRSPSAKVSIVTYYFWLSGSKLQRSSKGFLCSIIRQLVLADKALLSSLLDTDDRLLAKQNLGDWSVGELQSLLKQALDQTSCFTCLFLDGLDEFDPDDDVENLLGLIGNLSPRSNVKICVSSRPENHLVKRLSQYRHLRLQDLTKDDMRICIQEELELLRARDHLDFLDKEQVSEIVDTMSSKANGVFLWVRFVLRNIARGIRNYDGFDVLLTRIKELPSGMRQVYSEMWERLNGDEMRYRQEAADYFSCVMIETDLPLSLFELWVALDPGLQKDYLESLSPQDPIRIARGCEILKARILSRCAGLLEVETVQKTDEPFELLEASNLNTKNDKDRISPSSGNDRSRDKNEGGEWSSSLVKDRPDDGEESRQGPEIVDYYRMKVRFIHRTARDFLNETEDGQALLGKPLIDRGSSVEMTRIAEKLYIAKMASLIQRLVRFDQHIVSYIMMRIKFFRSAKETELVVTLEKVCKALSNGQSFGQDISQKEFWTQSYDRLISDFAGKAARLAYADYICHFLGARNSQLSPKYFGYLFLCAATGLSISHSFGQRSEYLPMLTWLVDQGADLFTPHEHEHGTTHKLSIPIVTFLLSIIDPGFLEDQSPGNNELVRLTAQTIRQVVPFLKNSTEEFPIALRFSSNPYWRCRFNQYWEIGFSNLGLITYMTTAKLCRYAMQYLERASAESCNRCTLSTLLRVCLLALYSFCSIREKRLNLI